MSKKKKIEELEERVSILEDVLDKFMDATITCCDEILNACNVNNKDFFDYQYEMIGMKSESREV